MSVHWFDRPASADAVGGKGYSLCAMTRAGLPVPSGFCIPVESMDGLRLSDIEDALARLAATSVAVRSSAVGEDAELTSFAGIHATRLNVRTAEQVQDALDEIRASGSTPAAAAYRRRMEIMGPLRMAAVVQAMVVAESAGVLFTQDPVDHSDRIVIEGTWGLGESVVTGIVTPDRWTLARSGEWITADISNKDAAIVPGANGTTQIEVDEARRHLPCLETDAIMELVRLARSCEDLFGAPQDVEWAVASGKIWLLQSRSITGKRPSG